MKTLQIQKNNFWLRVYCIIYLTNKNSLYDLPENTCELRKFLLIGIPLGILVLPTILVLYIIKFFSSSFYIEKRDRVVPLMIGGIFTALPILFFGQYLTKSFGLLGLYGQLFFYSLASWIIVLILFGIIVLIVHLLYKINIKEKPKKEKKPSLIKELYLSAKNKYCSKIEYVD